MIAANKSIFGRKYITVYADSDVNAFIVASGITSSSQTDALNYLITNLKSYSLWSKFHAVYPMIGNSASSHKYNAKNPADTDAAFRITFSGGTHSANGFVGNGGYGNTHIIPSADMLLNSNGITIAIGTTTTAGNQIEIGCFNGTTQRSSISSFTTGNLAVLRFNGSNQTFTNTDARGIYTGQRTSSTVSNSWLNGVKKQTNNSGGTLSSYFIAIGGINQSGSINNASDRRLQSIYIHQGFNDTEAGNLHTIIDTYENMLSRKTW